MLKKVPRFVYRKIHHALHRHRSWNHYDDTYYTDGFMEEEHFILNQQIICDYIRERAQQVDKLRILDAGAGNGRLYDGVKDIPNLEYVGIDFTPKLVAAARQLHPEAEFQQMDVQEMTFPDKSFDMVLVQHVIRHLPYYDRAMGHFFRVSRGEVVIAEKEISLTGDRLDDYFDKQARSYRPVNIYDYDKMVKFVQQYGKYEAFFLNDGRQNPDGLWIVVFKPAS